MSSGAFRCGFCCGILLLPMLMLLLMLLLLLVLLLLLLPSDAVDGGSDAVSAENNKTDCNNNWKWRFQHRWK